MHFISCCNTNAKTTIHLRPFVLKTAHLLIFNALVFSIIIGHPPAIAAAALVIDADAQYTFAQKLFKNEAYSEAIAEFQRFVYFFPQDPRIPAAMILIGRAYQLDRDYPQAMKVFRNFIDRHEGREDAVEAYFYLSDVYMALHQPQLAMVTMENLVKLSDDAGVIDKAYYRMGWIAIEAGAFQSAAESLTRLSPQFQSENSVDALLNELKNAKDIPQKKPTLAGALSVVPGAGQLYCGRFKDALTALLVNTGLIWAAVESYEHELYALGTTITIFEFGFYAGNIHGAITSAYKYNQSQAKQFVKKIQQEYKLGQAQEPLNNSIMISFQYLF